MIEEAYEVLEAIDNEDNENLCEELGDVLLQVVMHSVIAEEEGTFTIGDVIQGEAEKMIRRHPHVFGEKTVNNSDEVLLNWDEIKAKENRYPSIAQELQNVPKSLPANLRAEKVQKKAKKFGFDFKNYNEVLDKVREELEELQNAIDNRNDSEVDEEIGDMLFSIINLSRYFNINAENSLTNAINKFINRIVEVEILAKRQDKLINEMSIKELNALWEDVKKSQ